MPSKDKKTVTVHLDPSVVAKIDEAVKQIQDETDYYTSRSRVVAMLIQNGLRARGAK